MSTKLFSHEPALSWNKGEHYLWFCNNCGHNIGMYVYEEDNYIPFIWVPLQIVTCCSYSSMSGKPSGEIRSRFTNTLLSKWLRCLLFILKVIFCAWKKLSCPNWETEGAVCEEGVAWPDRKHNLILTSERFEGPPSVTLLSHKGHWRDPCGFCLILDPEKTRDIPRYCRVSIFIHTVPPIWWIPQVKEFNLVLLHWQKHKQSNPWIKNSYFSRSTLHFKHWGTALVKSHVSREKWAISEAVYVCVSHFVCLKTVKFEFE